MSIENAELNLKLEVKKQWFCDYCGEIIKSDKDGTLEWDAYPNDNLEMIGENFRIVHNSDIETCKPRSKEDNLSDLSLHFLTGSEGLSNLLRYQATHKIDDLLKFQKIIRRLHVDYYEEAIKYLPQALEDEEYDIDPDELGDISENNLKWLIKTYGK